MRRVALVLVHLACSSLAFACVYGEHGFDREDKDQTTAFDLINEKYAEEQKRDSTYFRQVLKEAEDDRAAKADDADWQDDYAYALFRTGKSAEAYQIWASLLKKDPKRYSTLCNLATALHGQTKFDDAIKYLKAAIALRPGFRNGAEEFHLRMIEFQVKQRSQNDYATQHLFVDILTPFWLKRKFQPDTLEDAEGFPRISADGLAELLRQYPRFGDGWLVLGMVLEHSGDHYLALRAYQRADKFGTGQRDTLKTHLRTYTDFALSKDAPRSAARKLTWAVIILVGTGLAYALLKFARMIVLDITSADRNKAPLDPRKKDPK